MERFARVTPIWDPQLGVRWAASVSDEVLRHQILSATAEGWLQLYPGEAKGLIEASALSEAKKQELLERIERAQEGPAK